MSIAATAHARVGLLGNPSDLYGGFGLGFAVRELAASVELAESESISIPAGILVAGWQVFTPLLADRGIDPVSKPFALASTSEIPFQAGLAGSSAMLVAAIRAWSQWFHLDLARSRIAELAWKAENELLAIRAGPLDRLVQAHEGLVAMDFTRPFEPGAIERLDPDLLPPLLLAWHGRGSASSGDVHAPVFERWQGGDIAVTTAMNALAENARAGRMALLAGDRSGFLGSIDRNFDLRRSIFPIDAADRAMVECARSLGAAAKFPGSGGAVLIGCRDEPHRDRVESEFSSTGHTVLRPSVAAPAPRVRAVFLAAGFATRLWPITRDCAKPLLEVRGEPLISRVLRQAVAAGVADGVVVANARFHRDFLAWRDRVAVDLPLEVVDDGATSNDDRLGAVRDLELGLEAAKRHWGDAAIDAYLVLGCDNLFDFDLRRMVERFAASGRGQLLVRTVTSPVPPSKYSEVVLERDGRSVRSFREKPLLPASDLSAIAAYLLPADLPQRIREHLSAGGPPDAPGHLIAALAAGMTFEAQRLEGEFLDIGTPEDLERARSGW